MSAACSWLRRAAGVHRGHDDPHPRAATGWPPDSTLNPVAVIALFPVGIGLTDLGIDSPTVTKAAARRRGGGDDHARDDRVACPLVRGAPDRLAGRILGPGSRRLPAEGLAVPQLAGSAGCRHRGTREARNTDLLRRHRALPVSSFWFFGNYQFLLPKTDFAPPPGRAVESLVPSLDHVRCASDEEPPG